jgi:hypothetical protein
MILILFLMRQGVDHWAAAGVLQEFACSGGQLQNSKGGVPRCPDRLPLINGRCDYLSEPGLRPQSGLRRLGGQLLAAAHAGGRHNDGGVRHYVGMVSSANWLDRYRAGQHHQVWHELRQLGAAVREPGLSEQAQLVCDEMARRARRNIEVIIERLSGAGYRFHSNDDAQEPVTPHFPPAAGAAAHANWLQQRFGPVPMTLLSWVRLVGDVWLVGTHPQWAESASADPLVIEAEGSRYPGEPISGYFDSEHEVWREWAAHDPAEAGLFVLPLAPDLVHKNNFRGGPPYGLILPDGSADELFAAETTMPFVSYLNWVFRHGGFPGRTAPDNRWQMKRALARDLLPL